MRPVEPSDVWNAIVAAGLFVAIICFWCMLDIAAKLAFRFEHFGGEELTFLASITILVLGVTLMLARVIAKLLPNTAGRVVFQFKKKKEE